MSTVGVHGIEQWKHRAEIWNPEREEDAQAEDLAENPKTTPI